MLQGIYTSGPWRFSAAYAFDNGNIYGNFQHEGDSLFMQYYSKKAEKTDTVVVEQSFGFRPLNNVRVRIATLDNDRLVLTKDNRTWSFRKY